MAKCDNLTASVNSLESFALVDGPGIRTAVFFNGCLLRCLYCHNPEMWSQSKDNTTVLEIFNKIVKNKPYFGKNGGVTLTGGEPLLQSNFIIALCKKLKKEHIHIALDTAGVGLGNYNEILSLIDLVILDIKHLDANSYQALTSSSITSSLAFHKALVENNSKLWIRQVIVPGIHDNLEYIKKLKDYLCKFKNIERIEFLPYHKLGEEKYQSLMIPYPLKNIKAMDSTKCEELYQKFLKL